MKTTLIILEGQDRTGKDTVLNFMKDKWFAYAYKQPTSEEIGIPYKDNKETYQKWLLSYIGNQIEELKELSEKYSVIAMTRLLTSDNVFSEMFGRDNIVEKTYKEEIYKNFDVIEVCLLWESYEAYLKRLIKIREPVQYLEKDFLRIKTLFLKHSPEGTPIILVNNETKTEDLYNYIKEIYERHNQQT